MKPLGIVCGVAVAAVNLVASVNAGLNMWPALLIAVLAGSAIGCGVALCRRSRFTPLTDPGMAGEPAGPDDPWDSDARAVLRGHHGPVGQGWPAAGPTGQSRSAS